jgi:curved DNA-binding protein CbpA
MNGNLSENPLTELVREVSHKKISGRLQLQREKAKLAIYFQSGSLIFTACNLQDLRLGAYLVKHAYITADDLRSAGAVKDFELARALVSSGRISKDQADELHRKLVEDIFRVGLLWIDATWEFDSLSQLNEEVDFKIDVPALLLEATRRLPAEFISTRFRNPDELFIAVTDPANSVSLTPVEGFLLSRIDTPTSMNDLQVVSGLSESEVQRSIYSLAVIDMVNRESWKEAFRSLSKELAKPAKPITIAKKVEPVATVQPPSVAEETPETVESFLQRLANAHSHYEVLNVSPDTVVSDLKNAYYNLARKYHPDRFRNSERSLVAQIESAFARITQAYDTLRDPKLRSSYDSKLNAQARASRVAQAAPKGATTESSSTTKGSNDQSNVTLAQHAEAQFKEGFAALELGQRNVALGLLGAAARAVPTESRYRAYYGRALALNEGTRRLAEAELQAALKLEPNNAEYRIMLAELYRDLGFKVRARSEAVRAIASDPNNRKARDLLETLN